MRGRGHTAWYGAQPTLSCDPLEKGCRLCLVSSPAVSKQPHVCSSFPPGSSCKTYRGHFCEPGLCSSHLSPPRTRSPCPRTSFSPFPTIPPPVFSIASLPPPIFPVRSRGWQDCNLWREARRGLAAEAAQECETATLPRGQEMQVVGGAVKQPR